MTHQGILSRRPESTGRRGMVEILGERGGDMGAKAV